MGATNATKPAGQKPADEPSGKTQYKELGDGAVSGNLTRDPELRYTPAGRAIANMRIASTERHQDPATGEWKDQGTAFYDVLAWGNQGERCAEHLRKGMRVVALGRWQEQTWTDPEGQPRSKTVLLAADIGPSLLFADVQVQQQQKARK